MYYIYCLSLIIQDGRMLRAEMYTVYFNMCNVMMCLM